MNLPPSLRISGLVLSTAALILTFQNCSLDSPGGSTSKASSGLNQNLRSADIVFQSVPPNQIFYLGGPGIVNVVVTSTAALPLNCRWYRNGVELIGQTSSILNIPAVSAGDAGSYKLVASNSTGSNFIEFTVSISSTPVISVSQQPTPITVMLAQNGSLSALGASSDNQSLLYQWYKDGVQLAGFNTPNLAITNATIAHAGMYHVEVLSTFGPSQKIRSNSVKVTVQDTIALGANGCVNGYCACVTPNQLYVPHTPSAQDICAAKGFTTLITFMTTVGPLKRPHCNASGSNCFINANPGNIVCSSVTCSR